MSAIARIRWLFPIPLAREKLKCISLQDIGYVLWLDRNQNEYFQEHDDEVWLMTTI
jgi:hypothetical protein